ncbi:MAG: hypothetical protein ACAH80_07195 [Alphaproteobacteria bacterium]
MSEMKFKGKSITDRERKLLEDIFDEKIDDLDLCQSIMLAAMLPEHTLERGAITRALTKKKCDYGDGARAVKKLIRRVRKRDGYTMGRREKLSRASAATKKFGRTLVSRRGEVAYEFKKVLLLWLALFWNRSGS